MTSSSVLGFNNNVRHRGRVFHLQTEDSGIRNPRIVTHLFADGGRIIKTLRSAYSEHLKRADLPGFVRQMMKAQHKAMFSALRSGELDELLLAACGPFPIPSSSDSGAYALADSGSLRIQALSQSKPASAETLSVPIMPSPLPAAASEPSSLALLATIEPGQVISEPTLAAETKLRSTRPSGPSTGRKSRGVPPYPPKRPESPTLSRPVSRYGSGPSKSAQSIFGDGVIPEKSLDDAILGYLAEDPKESPK